MATNRKRFQQRFFSAKTCRIAIFWPKNQKKSLFLEKKLENVCRFKKKPYLCTRFETQTTSRTKKRHTGALVQLVRIHACHAWGHGFESRTHRKKPFSYAERLFCLYILDNAIQSHYLWVTVVYTYTSP